MILSRRIQYDRSNCQDEKDERSNFVLFISLSESLHRQLLIISVCQSDMTDNKWYVAANRLPQTSSHFNSVIARNIRYTRSNFWTIKRDEIIRTRQSPRSVDTPSWYVQYMQCLSFKSDNANPYRGVCISSPLFHSVRCNIRQNHSYSAFAAPVIWTQCIYLLKPGILSSRCFTIVLFRV